MTWQLPALLVSLPGVIATFLNEDQHLGLKMNLSAQQEVFLHCNRPVSKPSSLQKEGEDRKSKAK